MPDRKRFAAIALVGLGVLIGFAVPTAFEQSLAERSRLALAIAGGLTTFGGGFWYGHHLHARTVLDERAVERHHHAGWNGFLAICTVLGTAVLVFQSTTISITLAEVDLYLMVGGLFVYILTIVWDSRPT